MSICAKSSPPVYQDLAYTCTKPAGHTGDHAAVAGDTGEVFFTWNQEDPLATDRLLRAIFPERFGPLPRKRRDEEGESWE